MLHVLGDQTGADARAEEDDDRVARAASGAEPHLGLAQGPGAVVREVRHGVGELAGRAEQGLQRDGVPADRLTVHHRALLGRTGDDSRDADPDAEQPLGSDARLVQHLGDAVPDVADDDIDVVLPTLRGRSSAQRRPLHLGRPSPSDAQSPAYPCCSNGLSVRASSVRVRSKSSTRTRVSPTSTPIMWPLPGTTRSNVRGRPPSESTLPASSTRPSATSSATTLLMEPELRPVAGPSSKRLRGRRNTTVAARRCDCRVAGHALFVRSAPP